MTPEELFRSSEYLAQVRKHMVSNDVNAPPFILEHLQRSVVAGLYYACYHAAIGFAQESGYSYRKEVQAMREAMKSQPGLNLPMGMHSALWHWFEYSGYPELSVRCKGLQKKRVDAAYKLNKPFLHNTDDVTEEAVEIMRAIEEFRPSTALDA